MINVERSFPRNDEMETRQFAYDETHIYGLINYLRY